MSHDVYPRGTARPTPNGTVQVLMTERMARLFEERCLGPGNTVADTRLSPPMVFHEDDLPTYIIELTPS